MLQCSAGKSKKASRASRSFVRQASAFSYLGSYLPANTSIAASAAARVGAPWTSLTSEATIATVSTLVTARNLACQVCSRPPVRAYQLLACIRLSLLRNKLTALFGEIIHFGTKLVTLLRRSCNACRCKAEAPRHEAGGPTCVDFCIVSTLDRCIICNHQLQRHDHCYGRP